MRYELIYEKRNSRITYFLSLNEINVVALTKGNKTQQIEAFDKITNLCLKPSEPYDGVSKWCEVLFYMMITNRKEYFEMEPAARPVNFHFITVDNSHKHQDITDNF